MRNGMIRTKTVRFAQVSNEALRDPELSLGAKGLYALIQSYVTIPGFVLYKNTLKKCCIEGETAFEGRWQELKQKGYLIQYKIKDKKSGKFYYEYDLLDEKHLQKSEQKIPPKSTKKEPRKPPKSLENSESYHPPKNHPLDNPPGGEVGVYNKTDTTHTYSIKSVSQSTKDKTDRRTDLDQKDKKDKEDREKVQRDQAALEAVLEASGLTHYTGDHRKALEAAIRVLWTRPHVNHQGRPLDRVQIREQLHRVDLDALDWACHKYGQALQTPSGVKNHSAYLQMLLLSSPDDAPAAAMAAYADL